MKERKRGKGKREKRGRGEKGKKGKRGTNLLLFPSCPLTLFPVSPLLPYGRVTAPVFCAGMRTAGGVGLEPLSRPAIRPLRVNAIRLSLLEP